MLQSGNSLDCCPLGSFSLQELSKLIKLLSLTGVSPICEVHHSLQKLDLGMSWVNVDSTAYHIMEATLVTNSILIKMRNW